MQSRAASGVRTRDLWLGKRVLYQLSYCRIPLYLTLKQRADTRTRTGDPRITNALLYQLSHIGFCFLLKCDAKVLFFFLCCKFIASFFGKKYQASAISELITECKQHLMTVVRHLLTIAEVVVPCVVFRLVATYSSQV